MPPKSPTTQEAALLVHAFRTPPNQVGALPAITPTNIQMRDRLRNGEPLPATTRDRPRIPLNPGALCYRNAVLSILLCNDTFMRFVINQWLPERKILTDACSHKHRDGAMQMLRYLWEAYWDDSVSGTVWDMTLEQKWQSFITMPVQQDVVWTTRHAEGAQHDAYELLVHLLGTERSTMLNPNGVPCRSSPLFESLLLGTCTLAETKYSCCARCGSANNERHVKRETVEVVLDISLPKNGRDEDLATLVKNTFKHGGMGWFCPACDDITTSTERTKLLKDFDSSNGAFWRYINRLPEILYMRLNRSKFIRTGPYDGVEGKNFARVNITSDDLDLVEYLHPDAPASEKVNTKYELVGVVKHEGKAIAYGHYNAHVKRNDKWYVIDDQNPPLRETDFEDSASQPRKNNGNFQPYLLMWQRKIETKLEEVEAMQAAENRVVTPSVSQKSGSSMNNHRGSQSSGSDPLGDFLIRTEDSPVTADNATPTPAVGVSSRPDVVVSPKNTTNTQTTPGRVVDSNEGTLADVTAVPPGTTEAGFARSTRSRSTPSAGRPNAPSPNAPNPGLGSGNPGGTGPAKNVPDGRAGTTRSQTSAQRSASDQAEGPNTTAISTKSTSPKASKDAAAYLRVVVGLDGKKYRLHHHVKRSGLPSTNRKGKSKAPKIDLDVHLVQDLSDGVHAHELNLVTHESNRMQRKLRQYCRCGEVHEGACAGRARKQTLLIGTSRGRAYQARKTMSEAKRRRIQKVLDATVAEWEQSWRGWQQSPLEDQQEPGDGEPCTKGRGKSKKGNKRSIVRLPTPVDDNDPTTPIDRPIRWEDSPWTSAMSIGSPIVHPPTPTHPAPPRKPKAPKTTVSHKTWKARMKENARNAFGAVRSRSIRAGRYSLRLIKYAFRKVTTRRTLLAFSASFIVGFVLEIARMDDPRERALKMQMWRNQRGAIRRFGKWYQRKMQELIAELNDWNEPRGYVVDPRD